MVASDPTVLSGFNINAIWLFRYMSQPEMGTSKVWWDHLVVAKKYIGPLTPANP